ncbi:MAG: CHAT domain-containing protein [Chloroflexota bacterium]|nr:CHAT domain-containing protein [Chloroflexota bacterium]
MTKISYRDFDLKISAANDGRYEIEVLQSPSGQGSSVIPFLLADGDLQEKLARLEKAILGPAGPEGIEEARLFGSAIFDTFISGDVRTVYDRSRQATQDAGVGLRLRLRIAAPELEGIPWEFLYDSRHGEFISLSRYTPLVRYLELALPDSGLSVKPPLRILGMVARPQDMDDLDVRRERERLEQALAPLRRKRKVELVWLEGDSWRDLHQAMQEGPWHIFHFIGHAAYDDVAQEGVLLLADDSGNPSLVTASQLGQVLSDQPTLRMVVLNACEGAKGGEQSLFSSLAAALVQRGLPAVLAMQYEISDRAAIEFTTGLYGALAANLPVDAAVSEARKAIDLAIQNSIEWGTPVLYMRSPDGVLWDVKPRFSLPLLAGAGAVVIVAILLAVIAWNAVNLNRVESIVSATPTSTNVPTPVIMGGGFNVAVADFGQRDEPGRSLPSETGRVLSGWLAEGLVKELQQNPDVEGAADFLVWHDTLPDSEKNIVFGTGEGTTSEERQQWAADLAGRVKAHMVVYGDLVDEAGESGLQISFYLAPEVAKEQSSIVGTHSLGKLLLLPESFDLGNPTVNRAVRSGLATRSKALFWLTSGLTEQLLGQSDKALETFLQAEEALKEWDDKDGKELLYFFIGREYLSQDQYDDAEAYFTRAIDINQDYARAMIALGSVFRRRLQAIPVAERSQHAETEVLISGAAGAMEEGARLADRTGDSLLKAIARIQLSKTKALIAEIAFNGGDLDVAEERASAAGNLADEALSLLGDTQQYRIIAQAYEALGAAHFVQGIVQQVGGEQTKAQEQLEIAAEAYRECIDLGELDLFDATLQDIVIEEGCRPNLEKVQEFLPEAEGK